MIDRTGARGLAGDLFVDGALGSRTAWLHEPYADAPDCCGNSYLATDAITAHLAACTEAGVTAGFHVIGDAAVAAVVAALDRSSNASAGSRWPASGIVWSTSRWSPTSRRPSSAAGE